MQLRNLQIPAGAVFAPMAGLTDAACRHLMADHGAAWTVSEMASAKALTFGDRKSLELLQDKHPHGLYAIQLFGAEPETLEKAILFVREKGVRFDMLDINMGCPAPKITGSGAGSKLLLDPPLCGQMVAAARRALGDITFVTATDGNHGRGVAWAARLLGQKAVVHMPKGSSQSRFDNIAKEGAKVTIEEVNYDDCVRIAAAEAAETEHGVVVQDTAWEGYEEIPAWIMQGYGTMANEAADQLRQVSVNRPTHVFVQAGVGSLAGAVVGYFTNLYPNDPPKFVVMEARAADCLYQGAVAGDGDPRIVGGDLQTIMAGLACGEPNIISWDILRNHVSAFVSCPDWVSAKGMRMLSAPVKGDPRVISGESGAVGMGLLSTIMQDEDYKELREYLELDQSSQVLMFSTEGDTDPDKYKEIVWEGQY